MISGITRSFGALPRLPDSGALNFKPAAGSRHVLPNGLVIYLLKDATLPVVHLNALVKAGKSYDPPDKAGVGELTAALLKDGGTRKYKSDEIDSALEFLGAEIESSMGLEEARVEMFSLKKDLDRVLDMYASVLMEPAFEDEKTAVKKAEAIEVIRRRNDDPARAAQREALRAFYGAGHPYGRRSEIAGIESLGKADLIACHDDFYRPNNIIITAAGDFGSEGEMLARLEAKFGGWKRRETAFPAIPRVEPVRGRRAYLIRKDIPQAFLAVLQPGIKHLDPAEFPLAAANEVLGGNTFTSRMTSEIRSRKGLAYSVYSYFSKRREYGHLNASCGTKPETYSLALSEMLRQFAIMKNEPVPAAELDDSKNSIINSFVFRFATPFALLNERALYEHYGYPPDYLDKYVDNLSRVDAEAVLEVSKQLFKPEDALIFVIGDPDKFDKPLSDFGPVTELKED